MAKRWKMSRRSSQRDFRRRSAPHPKNLLSSTVMRGGIRL